MFLTTLSFLFSTPGWEPSLGGFPALSGAVGQFLLKDVVLLGAAIWSLGEALTSCRDGLRSRTVCPRGLYRRRSVQISGMALVISVIPASTHSDCKYLTFDSFVQ